jgi:hypothetical protein
MRAGGAQAPIVPWPPENFRKCLLARRGFAPDVEAARDPLVEDCSRAARAPGEAHLGLPTGRVRADPAHPPPTPLFADIVA